MLVIILTTVHLAIHIPAVQNYIAHTVVEKIQPKIDGKIEFSKLTIAFVSRLVLEDLAITGAPGDTLISAEKLAVYISLSDILQGDIRANRIAIKNGVFNYIEEGNKQSNLHRIFKLKTDPNDTTKGSWPYITIRELRIQDYRFNYVSSQKPKTPVGPGCMDYTNIGVTDINLRFYDVKTRPKKGITAKIHSLRAIEKSGLVLERLSCDFSLDKNLLTMRNLTLKEGYSHVKANYLTFGYNSGKDLKDFVGKIKLDADFTDTFLDFRTIGFFSPAMQGNNLQLILNGRVYGPIADMQSHPLWVKTVTGDTQIEIDFSMTGLPDITKTIFDARIIDLQTKSEEFDKIIASFAKGGKPIISPMLPNKHLDIQLDMLGTVFDFETEGRLHTSVGDASFDLAIKLQGKEEGTGIKGRVSTYDVDLGKILSNNSLGEVTAGTRADISLKGKEYGGMNIDIDSLQIDKFHFNGYDYKDIYAVGNYSSKGFDGRILGHDPNLHFKIQGIASTENPNSNSYKLFADIPYADLNAINIIKGEEKETKLSVRTMANLTTSGDNLVGNVNLNNITFWGDKEYEFNSISLSALFKDYDYTLNLDAPFIHANYTSNESPSDFIKRVKRLVLTDHFGETFTPQKDTPQEQDTIFTSSKTNIDITTFNTMSVCDIIMPDLYISDSTTIQLDIDEKDRLNLHLISDRLGFKTNSFKALDLSLKNTDTTLIARISGDGIGIGDMILHRSAIDMDIKDGLVDLHCRFDNSHQDNTGLDFHSYVSFGRGIDNKLNTHISIENSNLTIKGHKWHFTPSTILIGAKNFIFNNFKLSNEHQFISIDGAVSEDPDTEVKVNLNEFDLAFANSLLKKNMDINGTLTGYVSASALFDSPNIIMDLDGKDLSLMARSLGDLKMISKWDQTNSRMNILVQNQIEGMMPLNVTGYFQPNGKFVNAKISFKEFGLSILDPFLQGILANTGGTISGDIEVIGTMDRLSLISNNTRLNSFTFTPVFTKVPYVLNGPVQFSRNAITLQNLKVTDKFNNEGTLNGSLRHNSLKDMYLDATLAFKNLQCLNSTEKDNQTFYGSAYASGNIHISGPFDNLFADVTATTEAKTAIHVPLTSASSAKSEDLLKFTNPNTTIKLDPYLEKIKKDNKKDSKKKGKKSNFSLQAKATITSDTELFVEINKQLGDILKCRGNGVVDVSVDPSRSLFDLKGDYTIEEGSYKFVLMGITAKDFIIDNGGSINFNGNIRNTSLNVGATYQTKASISTLISDTSAVGNRRTVDCGIKMSGSLSNPNIGFSINVQDLDPITKGRVESALSTDDKVQKQFMALLISGSFVPDEQSGIVNNTTILYSNAGEMLANQFNNVFRQLDIPLDLGLNFQPASDGKTHDVFDVALSYQAFNNRLIINGNVGNNQASQTWGGDFEAEVKLDQKGKLRLKAFTRAADDYSNYLDNTQRHGIGFTYQDEFDNFKELWRNIFWSKKRREEYETKLMLEAEKQIMEEDKANVHKKQIQQAKEDPFAFF